MRNSTNVPILRKSPLFTFCMRRSRSPIKQMMCHVKDDINLQINLFNSHTSQM